MGSVDWGLQIAECGVGSRERGIGSREGLGILNILGMMIPVGNQVVRPAIVGAPVRSAPRGRNAPAQGGGPIGGAALGTGRHCPRALKGRDESVDGGAEIKARLHCAPSGLGIVGASFPRALPGADESQPFRLKTGDTSAAEVLPDDAGCSFAPQPPQLRQGFAGLCTSHTPDLSPIVM